MASTNTNTSVAVSNTKEYYNPWAEHSKEDVEMVNKLEDAEQQRRIADVLGEQQRRSTAHQVSEIVSSSVRPSWFNKGSAYVLGLLKVARDAGNDLLKSSQVRQLSANFQIYAQRGIANAQQFAHKVEVAGEKAKETGQDLTADAKLKLQESKVKLQDTKVKLQDKFESAGDIAKEGIEKVQEVAKKIKKVSLKFIGKVSKAFNNLKSENTNLAFAVLEEENERQSRINSELEVYAILNALAVSSLLKQTAPALYRPAFEPSRKYSTKLICEYERTRRSLADVADHTAVNNAKAVSALIKQLDFAVPAIKAVPVAPAAPLTKPAFVEAPIAKKPQAAAM